MRIQIRFFFIERKKIMINRSFTILVLFKVLLFSIYINAADPVPSQTSTNINWNPDFGVVYLTSEIALIVDQDKAAWRTTDSGKNWNKINVANDDIVSHDEIIIDTDRKNILLQSNEGKDTTLYISKNYGETFTTKELSGKRFKYILPNKWKSGNLLALSTDKTVWISTDFGYTWNQVYKKDTVTDVMWDPIKNTDPKATSAIFAIVTQKDGTKLVYSNDNGDTETILVTGAQSMTSTDNFVYIGAYDKNQGGSNLFVRSNTMPVNNDKMGFLMCDFPFGDDIQPNEYKIIDDSTGAIWLGIQMKDNYRYGTVYTSDSTGSKFTKSMDKVSFKGQYDFTPISGLKGAYVANQIVSGNNFITKITYDNGGKWKQLNSPSGSQKGTFLNCYGITTFLDSLKEYGPFYSTDSAIGLALSTGNVGKQLSFDTPASKIGTYLTRDSGKSWKSVYGGPTIYEIGNHGTILLMANATGDTDNLLYSTDQGVSFKSFQMTLGKIDIKNIITDPEGDSTKFIILGMNNNNVPSEGIVFGLDFAPLGLPECTDNDHEQYVTPAILGHTITYTRVRQDANCFQKDALPVQDPHILNCTVDDYECDIGYKEVSPDDAEKLVCALEKDYTPPTYPPSFCPSGTKYFVTKGFRKVAGDLCRDGVADSYEPAYKDCSDGSSSGKSHGWVAAILILLGIAMALVGGAYYLHKNPDKKLAFYRKIGIIKEYKYSTLGIKPGSLADDEFGIEDDDAHILNDDDLVQWMMD
ncbi:PDZ domain-containing protein [Heterostelium album PN500]|uniref:PDZ domain-containing protein n=1 Tax=Heterostelium pallidum (strain ATCC 26659 / Pp 5 / PN500) TaxID=670386 RepID=D3BI16_HETP5|nr:PDZ domain-containing protein [Heterostelium album PN500]EFA78916.1 PDZ domain-containing protein [Heterostelium album PN500]|eukprot:XP_020431040.1 PDZ domain-containing protein [Heterostelium album PN500]